MLFTLHLSYESERHVIAYQTINECLDDMGLQDLLDEVGATCSLHVGQLTVVPCIDSAERLKRAVVSNATTLLRGRL